VHIIKSDGRILAAPTNDVPTVLPLQSLTVFALVFSAFSCPMSLLPSAVSACSSKAKAENLADGISGTDLEKRVKAATSNEHAPCTNSELQAIANLTHDYANCREIMPLVWKRIDQDREYWRMIYKVSKTNETIVHYPVRSRSHFRCLHRCSFCSFCAFFCACRHFSPLSVCLLPSSSFLLLLRASSPSCCFAS
jgi:hypothetical protein